MPPFSPEDHNHHLPRHRISNSNDNSNSNNSINGSARAFFGFSAVKLAEEENDFNSVHQDIIIDEEGLALGVSNLVGKWFQTDTEAGTEPETEPARHDAVHDQREEQPRSCSSRRRRRRSSSTNRSSIHAGLSMIPERRVAFAGTKAEKTFFGNHYYIATVEPIELFPVPHVSEYTALDKRRMWYSRRDISGMRKSCVRASLEIAKDPELYCPVTFRGLEYIIDAAIELSLAEERERNTQNGSDNDRDHHEPVSTFESRRWDTLEAVLDEQDRQRRFGEADPEAIRAVYQESGRTEASLALARLYALRDEACARDEDALSKQDQHAYYGSGGDEYGDGDYESGGEGGTSCHYLRISNGLPMGIENIFRMLLAPVLDIPYGDLCRVMGEECIAIS